MLQSSIGADTIDPSLGGAITRRIINGGSTNSSCVSIFRHRDCGTIRPCRHSSDPKGNDPLLIVDVSSDISLLGESWTSLHDSDGEHYLHDPTNEVTTLSPKGSSVEKEDGQVKSFPTGRYV
ncbi:uncharacterized protein A4U43_C08F17370 [Asparagus officinalis]|nr:uncharacterized protein A4U43_C08F17370 [Asparagus officinalis]